MPIFTHFYKLQNLTNIIKYPDYSKTKVLTQASYTAEFDCLVQIQFYVSRATITIKINNKITGGIYHDYGGQVMTPYFLRKGEVISSTMSASNFYITPLL